MASSADFPFQSTFIEEIILDPNFWTCRSNYLFFISLILLNLHCTNIQNMLIIFMIPPKNRNMKYRMYPLDWEAMQSYKKLHQPSIITRMNLRLNLLFFLDLIISFIGKTFKSTVSRSIKATSQIFLSV